MCHNSGKLPRKGMSKGTSQPSRDSAKICLANLRKLYANVPVWRISDSLTLLHAKPLLSPSNLHVRGAINSTESLAKSSRGDIKPTSLGHYQRNLSILPLLTRLIKPPCCLFITGGI